MLSIYDYILSSFLSEISITYFSNNKVRAAFTLFDHDGDGKVTIEELRLLYTSLGQNFSEVDNGGGDCGEVVMVVMMVMVLIVVMH